MLLAALAACSDPDVSTTTVPVGACDGLLTMQTGAIPAHVPMGTAIEWDHNPPPSGTHFQIWAAWDRQYTALERGYYVHNAEHGGIILLYRCDAGCPEVVDSLLAVARGMPDDPMCTGAVTKRVIVTGDPLLPDGVRVAAVAWNYAYTASCYDPYVETFATEHYAKAPENFCSDGANLGGVLIGP